MKSKRLFIYCIIFTLIAELICSYKSVLHRGQNPVVDQGWTHMGLEPTGPGEFVEIPGEAPGFIIENLQGKVDTLKIDLEFLMPQGDDKALDPMDIYNNNLKAGKSRGMWVEIWATDTGHALPYFIGRRLIVHRVSKSVYFTPEFAGDPKCIYFYITDFPKDAKVFVHDLALNRPIPLRPSPVRMIFFAALFLMGGALIGFIKTGGHQYKDTTGHRLIFGMLVAAQIAFTLWTGILNPKFFHPRGESTVQYQAQAHAFMEGELALPFDTPPALAQMENPYDRDLRNKVMEETGQSYRWDTGYYNGKYYMYFGVLPELLYFLPYYAVTGQDLETHTAIMISLVIYLLAAAFLIRAIVVRLYPHVSLELMGMMYILLTSCCGIYTISSRPEFYSLPVIVALFLCLWGQTLWVLSRKADGTLSIPYLALGSLFIALIAAARPQLVLCAGTGLFIWGDRVFNKQRFMTRDWLLEAAAILSPVILVAIPIMIYNKLRFGSPFSFGVEYNLTGTDYISRGMRPGRVGHGIFNYLLQTPATTGVFPFLANTDAQTGYLGERIRGHIYGGQLMICPVLFIGIYAVLKKGWFKLTRSRLIAAFLILLGFITAGIDVQIGIQTRYMCDFAWMFAIAAALAICEGKDKEFRKTLVILWIISLPVFFLRIFCDVSVDGDNIGDMNPVVFSTLEHLTGFWL